MQRTLSIITVCTGRQLHARAFVPHTLNLLTDADELVFVDYGDPQSMGREIAAQQPRRCTVVLVDDIQWFHATHARNIGARFSHGDLLCIADIDMLFSAALLDECHRIRPGEFLVQPRDVHSYGFLVLERQLFAKTNGLEEAICGYGNDDSDFWLKLAHQGAKRVEMKERLTPLPPAGHVRLLEHKCLPQSATVNARILRALASIDPKRNNVGRNWGRGGVALHDSHLRQAWIGGE